MITMLVDDRKRVIADAEAGDSQRRATSRRDLRGLNIGHRVRLWQRQDHGSAQPRGGTRRIGAILLATATALISAVVAPAQEKAPPVTTLVKNTGEYSDRIVNLSAFQDGLYQGFTTGSHQAGYELNSISLYVQNTHDSRDMTIDASLYSDAEFLTKVASLTRGPLNDYELNEWQAPADTFLEPNAKYYIVLDCVAGCEGDNAVEFSTTASYGEDSGSAKGWSIHNRIGFRSYNSSRWKWSPTAVMSIKVKGRKSNGGATTGQSAHKVLAPATGTIENSDPLQRAWLARFGRTAAQRMLDGVQARLRAPHQSGIQATVAGHDLSGVAQDRFKAQSEGVRGEATEVQFGPPSLTMRDLVTGSAFALSSETVGGLGTLWGRGGYSGFDGSANGLALDGGVTTGMLGADYAMGRWVVGLPLSHSRGDGTWHSVDRGQGRMASSLTGLYPYAGYELTDRLSLWGTAGYGQGDLALMMQEGESYHTAMDLTMAAVGGRGDLVRQAGGLSLAIESDALLVRTTSAAAADPSGLLASAVGDVSRLRLGLEGSLDLALAGGRSLTPTIELGLRHDGGDAETGFGLEVGGGTVFADAARGLIAQVMVRGLMAHEAADFRDWRASGSLRFDPTPSSALGPAVALTPSWGAPSSGGVAALLGRETLVGLAAYEAASAGRLDAEAAYGLAVFGGRATGTPYLRVGQSETFREVRMGYRLELLRWEGLEMGIEGTQRNSTVDDMAPDRGVMLHLALSAP